MLSNPIIKPVSLTPNPYCRCHFLYRVQHSFLGCMCCQWAVPVVGWYLLLMRGISGVGNGQVATEGSHCRSGCMGISLWASLVGFDRSWCGSMCWWFGFAAPRHRRAFHGVIELGVGILSSRESASWLMFSTRTCRYLSLTADVGPEWSMLGGTRQ